MCHEDLLERDGNICYLCNEPIDYEKYRRSYPYGAWIDHVIPIDAIGAAAETMENMRLTHGKCNRAKWATPLEEYLAKSR
jgi:5-methylcytosine-specific restriction endonuclease McrA